jgi:hypothetical protein
MLLTVRRAPGRAKQELLARVSPLRALTGHLHERRLRAFEPYLPALSPTHSALVDTVTRQGAAVTTVDDLGLRGTEEMKAGAAALVARLERPAGAAGDTVTAPQRAVLEEPAVWQWGLDGQLLDLVERYLGLPARYLGASVRRERATGVASGVRQWHRDIEDHRMLKVLLWLNDVDVDGGPFEYVDRSHTERIATSLKYVSGYVPDDRIERLVPRGEWRQATGPAWTCVLADPRNVFHRAMPPVQQDRYSVTFSYTSRSPLRVLPEPRIGPEEQALACRGLDERQLACLPPRYVHDGLPRSGSARRS